MSEILVTGAAGFIGSHVCEALLRRGDSVVGVDNFDDFYDPALKRRNLQGALSHPRFKLVEGNVEDADLMSRIITRGLDAIVHLAAKAGVRPSIEHPLACCDVNVRGTLTLLQACASHPRCRFVFGSSSSVYGNSPRTPFRESDAAAAPISPYAASKRAAELLCHTYHHLYRIPTTCLRFFTVYGPRQRPDLAVCKFVQQIEAGEPIAVFGDGGSRRDYTYVDDVVDGVVRALDGCMEFRTYNLGNSRPVSLIELIRAIERATGKRAVVESRPTQPGDVDCTCADIALAERELGWRPRVDLPTGLARFVEWFRHQPRVLATRTSRIEPGFGPLEKATRSPQTTSVR